MKAGTAQTDKILTERRNGGRSGARRLHHPKLHHQLVSNPVQTQRRHAEV
jgi:hypothetical protein